MEAGVGTPCECCREFLPVKFEIGYTDGRMWRFYVYVLTDEANSVIYVGKGSGWRLSVQRRRYRCSGHEIARFKRENDAYAFEREQISELSPRLNRHPGGNGSRVTPQKRYPRVDTSSRYPALQRLYDLCHARAAKDTRRFNELMESIVGMPYPWDAPAMVRDIWHWLQQNQAVRI